jgi:hypothetical protein
MAIAAQITPELLDHALGGDTSGDMRFSKQFARDLMKVSSLEIRTRVSTPAEPTVDRQTGREG